LLVSGGKRAGKQSRLEQLVKWAKSNGEFDGVVVFDECHKAKNSNLKVLLRPKCF
jgi:hypothetical protein